MRGAQPVVMEKVDKIKELLELENYEVASEEIEHGTKLTVTANFEQSYLVVYHSGKIVVNGKRNKVKERLDQLKEALGTPGYLDQKIKELKGQGEFWHLIHPVIQQAAKKLFDEGNHSEAAFKASKHIVKLVKERYEEEKGEPPEDDGTKLMSRAFSFNLKDNRYPIIQLTPLRDQVERDIQEGFMYLFMGFNQAVRNPGAHSTEPLTREECIHFLFVASLLAGQLKS
jgi:uncharacterized protein (TIGR02391 family)